jgi:hypothetical protein
MAVYYAEIDLGKRKGHFKVSTAVGSWFHPHGIDSALCTRKVCDAGRVIEFREKLPYPTNDL